MKNKCLIITADDYGVTPEVSLGIRKSISKGVVSCTSVMMNYVSKKDIAELLVLKEEYNIGIGLHVNLTEGISFVKKKEFEFLWLNDLEFIREEILIQRDKFVSCFGEIDHVNFHQHIHYDLRVLQEYLSIEKLNNVPVRYVNKVMHEILNSYKRKIPDNFVNIFPLGANSVNFEEYLHASVNNYIQNEHNITEWMVHPGYSSSELEQFAPNYAKRREEELRLLCRNELLNLFERNNIFCKNFRDAFND